MDMIGRIRRLHRRKRKSEREIARITGLSRNTVAKWLHGEVDGPPKYRRGERPNKLTAFHEALKQALEGRRPATPARAPHGQGAVRARSRRSGYDGGYSRVTDFIRAWRQAEGQAVSAHAFVPLAFELGEAFQFDWSEEGLVVGGIYYRVQVSHMKLCASPGLLAGGLPEPGPRDAVRCAHPQLRRAGRRGPARHLRQHEDRGGQGQEGQGPDRQRALRRDVRALPVRPRLLQRRLRLGEGGGREERAGQPSAHLDRRGPSSASAASPNSMPGWVSAAGRCGTRSATPSTSSSAWPRCSSTSGRT